MSIINKKILVLEDDLEIQQLLSDYLKASGFSVLLASDGQVALELFHKENVDLALLDIIVPKIDGFEVCRQIRNESKIPIIMLSSKREDTDKILALGLGADDYIEKPFSPRVLIAKIESSFRQFQRLSEKNDHHSSDIIHIDNIKVNLIERIVQIDDKDVPFSVKEFDILIYLLNNKNQALSREQIFDEVWGYNEFGDINTITVHMRKIREKIEKDPSQPKYIQTVWGIGYKFKI